MSSDNSLKPDSKELNAGGGSGDEANASSGRLADPDDYNLRRRLKQLHSAKEAVVQRKDDALDLERLESNFNKRQRDMFIAEKLVDYIHELRPLLRKVGREDEFLSEEVGTISESQITIESIIDTRGKIPDSNGRNLTGEGRHLPYEATMAAWDICNTYFEDVAGAEIEGQEPDPDENPVDPAGRFHE